MSVANRYRGLAADYDGTLAQHGKVDETTIAAIRRLKETGRRLVLVTGRELAELIGVFPEVDLFDRVVAENGAMLYRPVTREERALAEPPPASFVTRLESRGVGPIAVGRVIVATWQPHQTTVMEVIREMGLDLQVILNKRAVMVLPSGVDKASGLIAALGELGLAPSQVLGVGDTENDIAFLDRCGYSAALSNALEVLKRRVELVTEGDHGRGVVQLIEGLISGELSH